METTQSTTNEALISIYEQDRGEKECYLAAKKDDVVGLPLTKTGFEGMLEAAAKIYNLPIDNQMRQVLAGYVHHLGNDKNETTLQEIARVLYKAISNTTTWRIDQEIKEAHRLMVAAQEAEMKAKREQMAIDDAKAKREAKEEKKAKMRVVPKGTTLKHESSAKA